MIYVLALIAKQNKASSSEDLETLIGPSQVGYGWQRSRRELLGQVHTWTFQLAKIFKEEKNLSC